MIKIAPEKQQLCLEIAARFANDPLALQVALADLAIITAWHYGKENQPLAVAQEICAVMTSPVIDQVLQIQDVCRGGMQ